MRTELIQTTDKNFANKLEAAAQALRAGELVAFPTETVYGLAANAFLPEAVSQIFKLKGRPQDNPLIVHLADLKKIDQVVKNIPDIFYTLYEAFCPGPISFIMYKSDEIPAVVSAGLDTVAVRFPDQLLTRELMRLADVALVAPSANLSGKPSATLAKHVLADFKDRIPYILDGGATELGVESTVLDLTNSPPRILRPGVISAADILSRTGIQVQSYSEASAQIDREHPASPGLKYRHYAPDASVTPLMATAETSLEALVLEKIETNRGKKIGLFINEQSWYKLRSNHVLSLDEIVVYTFSSIDSHKSATRELFAALRSLDNAGVDLILAEAFPEGEAEAYMNRLKKACNTDDTIPKGNKQSKTILFVCTGNTCRSPMAEALFNVKAAKTETKGENWQAFSAGMNTVDGLCASPQAISVMDELGIDIRGHRSRQLTAEIAADADLIAVMTRSQRDTLQALLPDLSSKIKTLGEWTLESGSNIADISDPYAQSLAVYRETRKELESVNDLLWQKLKR